MIFCKKIYSSRGYYNAATGGLMPFCGQRSREFPKLKSCSNLHRSLRIFLSCHEVCSILCWAIPPLLSPSTVSYQLFGNFESRVRRVIEQLFGQSETERLYFFYLNHIYPRHHRMQRP